MFNGSHRIEIFDSSIELRVGRPDGGEAVGVAGLRPSWAAADVGERSHVGIDAACSPTWRNAGEPVGVRFERSGGALRRIVIERPTVSGAFTPTAAGFHGSFTVGGELDALLEGIMGLGLALLCERKGDLLLHAAAVARDGRAWLFLGEGGAGKTTIATALNGGRETLSVDKALVSARPDGALRVHGTPFGEGIGAPPRRGSAPIAGIFFIEQAAEHALAPLSRWEATRRLFGHAIAPSREPASVQRTMEAVGRLAELDAAYRLRFRKDEGFWPLIDEALSKG